MKFRKTKLRDEMLAVLMNRREAFSARALHAALPHIDLATIYRNLELFSREGIIAPLHLGTGETLYEYQPHAHHHAVCDKCEKVLHITAPEGALERLLKIENFDVRSVEVIVRGACARGH